MIAPPSRPGPARASTPAPGRSVTPSPEAPLDPGDAEAAATQAALDARIAALVARVQTPEDEALERQRQEFDLVLRAQAESDREINALRDLAMEQMKQDDELLKKWIALV